MAKDGHLRGRLECFVANKRSMDLYRRNGWKEIRRAGADTGQPELAYFEKALFADL